MSFSSIIATRRDGGRHTEAELRQLATGAADGSIPDYQLAAWLMAAYLNPLSEEETAWLTLAMANSGERIDLTGLPKPWVDKHSTGGVGDKTSIVLLPMLAACGLTVLKMSGRGLGITGGTIDKLESVPGFRTDLSPEDLKAQAARIGIAITGQSPDLAPADKTLYALRDVTETVGSIPLIVSSILSKKLAGGAEVIVLDVKCGSGAFMKTRDRSEALAKALAKTAELCGLHARIVVSDMTEPLGAAIGNALEVEEALTVLSGAAIDEGSPTARFRDLCLDLAALTIEAAGLAKDRNEAIDKVSKRLANGDVKRKASEWFLAQGSGDPFTDGFQLEKSPYTLACPSPKSGFLARIDAETVGRAVIALGGGRLRKEDSIDHSVGVVLKARVGSKVGVGETLFEVHAKKEEEAREAESRILSQITIDGEPVTAHSPILAVYT